eukprot:CAMPEP_0177220864 /NCGR_PEP_ID=MMETSP0367-20130122/37114_1 /TAXON_ID=447022 ORGANISM="Scrippsiella hangoei-like, Strain SHHI-4" /NCGR_SAMPLE_ID=MMETSP0367 /ASSEMBLY_ACC=CAM_ASM_000362 /LENGTH=77 /DNA_ID=CAMNT_0018670667 /DNA_START=105 /DNA_END=338 /DNA_ORIENTATION=+
MATVVFTAGMTCEGCSGAITKILKKMDGVEEVKCDLEKKEVEVTYEKGKVTAKDMHEKMQKWATAAGKELGECPEEA